LSFGVAGFRPGRRGPFVLAKGPKTMLAVAWPPASAGASSSGALRGSPTPSALLRSGGEQTRGVRPESCRRGQTVLAFSPVAVALLGHATRPGSFDSRLSGESGG